MARLLRDPALDLRLQNVQRQRTVVDYGIVKGANIELIS
jgi:hypothetical protein